MAVVRLTRPSWTRGQTIRQRACGLQSCYRVGSTNFLCISCGWSNRARRREAEADQKLGGDRQDARPRRVVAAREPRSRAVPELDRLHQVQDQPGAPLFGRWRVAARAPAREGRPLRGADGARRGAQEALRRRGPQGVLRGGDGVPAQERPSRRLAAAGPAARPSRREHHGEGALPPRAPAQGGNAQSPPGADAEARFGGDRERRPEDPQARRRAPQGAALKRKTRTKTKTRTSSLALKQAHAQTYA